jgi:hypothetical protein
MGRYLEMTSTPGIISCTNAPLPITSADRAVIHGRTPCVIATTATWPDRDGYIPV